jgi:integrating conjugative element membrane protein (TIGR03745 family)
MKQQMVLIWFGFLFLTQDVLAKLPTQSTTAVGGTKAKDGDWLGSMKEMFGEATIIGVLLLSAIAFLYVGWAMISKFNDWRNDRAEWTSVAGIAIVGAIILIIMGFMMTLAIDVFNP